MVKDHPWDILEILGVTGLLAIAVAFLAADRPPGHCRRSSLIAYQAGLYLLWDKTVDQFRLARALVGSPGSVLRAFHSHFRLLPVGLARRIKPYASNIVRLAIAGES